MPELNDIIKKHFKSGLFGLERECIRVDENCRMSHKPHPECFGNKLTKKHITTDFSESQIEMITPPLNSIDGMYEYAQELYDYVCSNLEDEYLWCQSMPCIITGDIPVAVYEGDIGRQATEYREMLVKKYGGEKQLISGIHFNFSFTEELLKELYKRYSDKCYREFVDGLYLKIARNYIRYGFVIAYLCGCSNICHKTFDKDCIASLEKRNDDTYMTPCGVSLRNSKWGYRNIHDLFPSYDTAQKYVDSIHAFIDQGKLSYAKEYYSGVRLKGVEADLDSLNKQGIQYLEIRTIDINPFCKAGVDIRDLKFAHLFLLVMLMKDEEPLKDYQRDGQRAKETVALYGLTKPVYICDREYDPYTICKSLIEEVGALNDELELYDREVVDFQFDKLQYSNTYASKNSRMDFIGGSLELMKKYKDDARLKARAFSEEKILQLLEE